MNIYNYIFCFFCRFWGNKIGNGRLIGAVHVAFTMLMHMLLLSEIIRSKPFHKVAETAPEFPVLRDLYWLILIALILIIFFFYNNDRVNRLMREYSIRYSDDILGNIFRILFYMVIPAALAIYLAYVRSRAIY